MNINDIALTLESRVGPVTAVALLSAFGSADAIYSARPEELVRRAELNELAAKSLTQKKFHSQADREIEHIKKHGITAIASTDPDFPPLLRETGDYPHVLYVHGNASALTRNCVSMVGTRQISTYGQTMCDRLVRGLAERIPNLCIVSGLAFGVDVHCHRAALRYGIPTVGVVANALPGVTPAQHSDIAREIVAQGGAIVTELHSNSKQTGDFYIPRNRIIAAMSEGTVVVEAANGSGALTTADLANGYNRIVMAVPGRATDDVAWGVNSLIKSQKAVMVCTAGDIVSALGWDQRPEIVSGAGAGFGGAGSGAGSGSGSGAGAGFGGAGSGADSAISADARGLLGCFVSGNATSVDSLAEVTALTHSQLAPLLLELEFAGRVKRLPGGAYEKVS
jgi:DNA processing protein